VFAPVRARTNLTKGPDSREAGLAMIYRLMEAGEGKWRKLTGAHLVALVRAGVRFVNGELVEGSEQTRRTPRDQGGQPPTLDNTSVKLRASLLPVSFR
jgi:hypothetical protein